MNPTHGEVKVSKLRIVRKAGSVVRQSVMQAPERPTIDVLRLSNVNHLSP
jgi:hypothetical protein